MRGGPKTRAGLEHFRKLYNEHLGGSLTTTGDPNVADWEAIYDVYDVTLAALLGVEPDELSELRGSLRPCEPELLGCGEHWPRDLHGDGVASADNRRVEILLFDEDELPELPGDPPGATIYDPVQGRHRDRRYLPVEVPVLPGFEVIEIFDMFRMAKGSPPVPEDPEAFKVSMKTLFGDDLEPEAIERMRQAFVQRDVPSPIYEVTSELPRDVEGGYAEGTIYLDHLLREEYADDPGASDALGDGGTRFAAYYVHFHRLLYGDVEVAEVTMRRVLTGEATKMPLSLSMDELGTEDRAQEVWRAHEEATDQGVLIIDGEEIEIEFYKIEGQGAVHERITKEAAVAAGMVFDYRLDKGVAWPDVPTTVETPPVPHGDDAIILSLENTQYNTPSTAYAKMLTTLARSRTITSR